MLVIFLNWCRVAWVRMVEGWRSEEGSAVEKVILTAIFAALALAVGAIIVAKVTAKANSINLQ
jgi:hypothetical protein